MGQYPVQRDDASEAILIRPIRKADVPRLKELENGYEFEFGDDFIDGLCAVDGDDSPVMFIGAWRRAEVHMVLDKGWSTPGARLFLLKEMHEAMRSDLKAKGFGQAVTWFDDVKDRFKDRLQSWGWVKSTLTSWHKQL